MTSTPTVTPDQIRGAADGVRALEVLKQRADDGDAEARAAFAKACRELAVAIRELAAKVPRSK